MRDVAQELKDMLANAALFKMLDGAQLDAIAVKTRSLRVRANTVIVKQGDSALGSYWVVYGQVNVAMTSQQGGEKLIALLGPGKCFGLGEMLLERPHLANITATTDAMLLHTGRAAMLDVAAQNSVFAQAVMSCLGRQFYALVRDIGGYALGAHQRLASYLLRQSRDMPDAVFVLAATKTMIASRLSVTPETLSRLLRDFVADGLISMAGRRITVLDAARLSALVP